MRTFALILIFLFSISQYVQTQTPPKTPVVVSEVMIKNLKRPVYLIGTVEPIRKSLVSAIVDEIVVEYPYSEGDYVKAGQTIARQNTQKTKILLNEAINAKSESDAELKLAQDELTRTKDLHEKGIVSESHLDMVVSKRDALIARQKLLQNKIEQLEYDISKADIKAPFNGYITSEHSQIGEWLKRGDSVIELIDIDNIRVVVEMPEKYISLVNTSDEVEVTLHSLADKAFTGEVVSVVPQADQASRAFPVKIKIKNKDHTIKSSMSAKVAFLLGEERKVKLVLKDTIINNGDSKTVFVVRKNAAQPVSVITGLSYGGFVEVQGELNAGEQVVVRGNERLYPMQPVEVVSYN